MINLLYGTNAGYCEQTAVSMRSVFENNPNMEIHVYLLCENVPAALRQKMCSVADDFSNVQITCLNPGPFLRPLTETYHMNNWRGSSVQYIYACICDVFPKLDRILWLDGDIICCGSLQELWKTPMPEACVAAGLDCTPFLALHVDKPFYNTPFYFNAGVLLFDLENCRRHELQQRCRNILRGYGGKLEFCDQSMLNLALPPELVQRISLRWNYPAGVSRVAMNFVSRRDTAGKQTFSVEELNNSLADLRLIHYIGGSLPTKPWFAEYHSPFRVDYFKYRTQTPWKEEPVRSWPKENLADSFVTAFSKTWDTPGMGYLAKGWQALRGWGPNVKMELRKKDSKK